MYYTSMWKWKCGLLSQTRGASPGIITGGCTLETTENLGRGRSKCGTWPTVHLLCHVTGNRGSLRGNALQTLWNVSKILKYISIFKFKRKKTKENENKIKERLNASHGVLTLTTTEMFHCILNGFLAPWSLCQFQVGTQVGVNVHITQLPGHI